MTKTTKYQQEKLFYIHGYQSSPDSTKGKLFKETLNAKAIKYRDCKPEDLIVSDCLNRISDEIKNDNNAILIGSSLGGFLAASTAISHSNVKNLILLNPAIIPPYTNLDKQDGVPRNILEDMVDERLFGKKLDAEVTTLVGTNDDVVPRNWIIEFAVAQEATVKFLHDDHSFTKNVTKLPAIISKIIGQ